MDLDEEDCRDAFESVFLGALRIARAVANTAGANDVQLWGGIVINGNGITNNCSDAERAADQCHVTSEGQPSNYGGDDNAESSGILNYVIVKHTGFEVAPGDPLTLKFAATNAGGSDFKPGPRADLDDFVHWNRW